MREGCGRLVRLSGDSRNRLDAQAIIRMFDVVWRERVRSGMRAWVIRGFPAAANSQPYVQTVASCRYQRCGTVLVWRRPFSDSSLRRKRARRRSLSGGRWACRRITHYSTFDLPLRLARNASPSCTPRWLATIIACVRVRTCKALKTA